MLSLALKMLFNNPESHKFREAKARQKARKSFHFLAQFRYHDEGSSFSSLFVVDNNMKASRQRSKVSHNLVPSLPAAAQFVVFADINNFNGRMY